MRRREFLGTGALATLAAAAGRADPVRPARPGPAAQKVQPAPASLIQRLGSPLNLETPIVYFDRPITPTEVFFVRSHFGQPAVDPRRKLRIEGGTQGTLTLGVDDLRRFPQSTVTAVLACAEMGRGFHQPRVPGLQWGLGAMGQAEWTGVRLADILSKAGVPAALGHVALEAADEPPMPNVPRFSRSLPINRAVDPTTLVVTHMNGKPLSPAHGGPMRLCVPGWTGHHWVKWLRAIRLQKHEASGYFQQTAYRVPYGEAVRYLEPTPANSIPITTLPVSCVIAWPTPGAILRAGRNAIVGVAFSTDAISGVNLSFDGGETWEPAILEGDGGPGRWQVFRHFFQAKPGPLRITARAADSRSRIQPDRADWNPGGYLWNGWHVVPVQVRTA